MDEMARLQMSLLIDSTRSFVTDGSERELMVQSAASYFSIRDECDPLVRSWTDHLCVKIADLEGEEAASRPWVIRGLASRLRVLETHWSEYLASERP